MDPETAKAIEYGEGLLAAAIDLVGDAKVDLDEQWARHPHVVALTILCRTICNFRASLRLAQDRQVVEARALVRLMYENLLWLNASRSAARSSSKRWLRTRQRTGTSWRSSPWTWPGGTAAM